MKSDRPPAPDKLGSVRIPYPERIPLNGAAYFALALFLIQVLEGTALYFSVGCALFILLATVTFNTAGGLTRASGAYVFFYSMLVVIVGLCYKAYLGEPAQSNLTDPRTDIEAYVGSMAAMYAAVVVSRLISRKKGLLQDLLKEKDMHRASVGCMLFGALAGFAIALLGKSGAQLQSAFGQLNQLIPLGIIIGVIYEIRHSGGRRCTNMFVAIGAVYVFFLGVTGFSKQAMITPLFCWLLPICSHRYRLSAIQILGCFAAAFIIFYWLVPYSQYGRSQVPEDATLTQRVDIAARLLEHPDATRRAYLEDQAAIADSGSGGYFFGKPQGFWDRLQFISIDDLLISFTGEGKVIGFAPIEESFVNVVPHFLWPNKPEPKLGGNYYGREVGIIDYSDTTTGISFSPTAEAYHIAKWTGILILAPLLWFMLFTVFDSLLGDVRASPWGLLAMVLIAHSAPEGGLAIIPYLCSFTVEILIFCALFATKLAPVFAVVALGPECQNPTAPVSFRTAPPYQTEMPHE